MMSWLIARVVRCDWWHCSLLYGDENWGSQLALLMIDPIHRRCWMEGRWKEICASLLISPL